jgi:hypothetical protein
MSPMEVLRKASDEFRSLAEKQNHAKSHDRGPSSCPRCRLIVLADDCDRAADQLAREQGW